MSARKYFHFLHISKQTLNLTQPQHHCCCYEYFSNELDILSPLLFEKCFLPIMADILQKKNSQSFKLYLRKPDSTLRHSKKAGFENALLMKFLYRNFKEMLWTFGKWINY